MLQLTCYSAHAAIHVLQLGMLSPTGGGARGYGDRDYWPTAEGLNGEDRIAGVLYFAYT